ncbi:sensor domain-containing diguanylate cyclase [Xanthobacter autotrophicus]|uniref:GGDEF domain-containing protein n=1 Tax=Xanthobacter autotrophicus TaxID=280 RepID=UPI001E36825C|nr:sensor domain-containing diguanylate cyclase [Xanthobacter autotrophicus]UDQ90131.1 sensor domain-containing diguanylate cyclase [Xanthobacter autotrophicus]
MYVIAGERPVDSENAFPLFCGTRRFFHGFIGRGFRHSMEVPPVPDAAQGLLNGKGETQTCSSLASSGLVDSASDERFDRLTRLACGIYEADVAFLGLVDDTFQWHISRTSDFVPLSVPRRETICNVIVESGAPLVIGDTAHDPHLASHSIMPQLNPRFFAGTPLVVAPDGVIGSLCVMARDPRDQDRVDLGPLLDLAQVTADEVELLRLNTDLKRKSQLDKLTGLPNRRSFDEAMERANHRAQRLAGPLSLLMIDVDHFKAVNDRWGHQAGDTVLAAVGSVLARLPFRAQDMVARYGGDEFAVILPDTDEAGRDALAEALLAALRAESIPHPMDGSITASIGGATARGGSLSKLFRMADAALYSAKTDGRDCYRHAPPADRTRFYGIC